MLEGFLKGKSLSSLSKDYGCTPSTVTRAVKTFLTDAEFKNLKINRPKNINNSNATDNSLIKTSTLKNICKTTIVEGENHFKDDFSNVNHSTTGSSLNSNDVESFTEIIPLDIKPFTEEQKEVACKPLSSNSLPSTVFMLISKNNELESKPLKDFSDWSFLPEKDQKRLVIPLFSNHRAAKGNCSRNEKVLKVPNSNVFLMSLSYLISKGITRLIFDDSLISIDF